MVVGVRVPCFCSSWPVVTASFTSRFRHDALSGGVEMNRDEMWLIRQPMKAVNPWNGAELLGTSARRVPACTQRRNPGPSPPVVDQRTWHAILLGIRTGRVHRRPRARVPYQGAPAIPR